jgi:hypothetical protein
MSEYTAFDYEKQEWLDGEAARLQLIKQLETDLAFYQTDRGKAAWEALGSRVRLFEHLREMREELEALRGDQD